MPLFRYTTLSATGARLTGEIEAPSAAAAILALQQAGHYPVRAVPARPTLISRLAAPFARRRAAAQPLAVATHELASLIAAGLALDRALELVAGITSDRPLAAAFARLRDRVRGGAGLAAALEAEPRAFPRLYVTLVRAGEASGALDAALIRLAEHLERSNAVREQVKSALVYPLILVVTAGLSLTFVLTYVLPQFKPLFAEAGASLPLPTRLVMGAADLIAAWGWLGLLAVLAGVWALRRAFARPGFRRGWDGRLLRLPLVGPILAEAEAGRFARTLGTLLKAGVPLPAALGLARETLGNAAMAEAVGEAATRLRAGESLGALLGRSGLFPALASQLVRVGEETGKLDDMLLHEAGLFERGVARAIDRLLAALVPGLTILLGLLVAGIVASVMLALLKINDLAV